MIEHNFQGLKKWRKLLQIDGIYASSIGLWLKTHLASRASLQGQPLSAYLIPEFARSTWVKLLTMYSYSMPYETIANFPADLAIPALRQYVFSHWVRIRGGVYSYIEKILSRFSGELVLNTEIRAIQRSNHGVQIQGNITNSSMFERSFDQVVFATPPDQVLQLLSDPDPKKCVVFRHWRPNYATTILHCDRQFYEPYGIQKGSEF
ncbi:MAG: hypothetical protein HC936_12610 [Leptolyngbyaceae cyanobacterium SU_3_3]|nr:hypothetical protein [Leptolyngbyaceae cyanobacterium SU_3_3]